MLICQSAHQRTEYGWENGATIVVKKMTYAQQIGHAVTEILQDPLRVWAAETCPPPSLALDCAAYLLE